MIQKTFVLLKPDALQRRLAGRIIRRFEDKGLKIAALRMAVLSRHEAETLYAPHRGQDFFEPLVDYITAGPVIAMLLVGPAAIPIVRGMVGATFGPDAQAGTIRGDYACSRRFNLIHASDSEESCEAESAVFFSDADYNDYALSVADWEFTSVDL